MKSGFVSLVGRPNVGKSTLMNHLLERHIAITSNKPQTTRNMIQGIYNDDEAQIVFVDTPGIHKPTHKLGSYLNKEAYYSMVFNDTFGTAEYVEKDEKLSTLEKLNIFKCRNILRDEPWKEAFITYNNLGYMNLLMNFKSFIRKILGRK